MTIHSLFVLNKAGVCLYTQNFSKDFDLNVNLLTPFFSAIITFSETLVNRELEELEMSGLRFIFRIKKGFVFVLLTDISDSVLFITSRLLKSVDVFSRYYDQWEDVFKDSKQIENDNLDKEIDSLIRGEEDLTKNSNFYLKTVDFFNNLVFQNEILGGALISTEGSLIYTSLPSDLLIGSIKELEIRFMTGAMHLPELYYSLENDQKIFSTIIEHKEEIGYYMVLYFDKTVPLGLAQMNMTKVSKQMKKLLSIYI